MHAYVKYLPTCNLHLHCIIFCFLILVTISENGFILDFYKHISNWFERIYQLNHCVILLSKIIIYTTTYIIKLHLIL